MSKNSWDYMLSDSFLTTQNALKSMTASLEAINRVSQAISITQNLSGAFAAVESFQSVLRNVYSNTTFDRLAKSATVMQSALANIQIPTVVDMIPTIERLLPMIDTTWKVPSIDWDWMSKTLATYENLDQEETENLLTTDVCKELDDSIQEIMVSDNTDDTVKSKFLEWQNRHPVLAFVLIQILLAIIINIASGVLGDWVTGVLTKKANLYEEANATSNIVLNIDIDQNVTILKEVPYYYEIVYTEPETGEEIKGYIYKANIVIEKEKQNVVIEETTSE